MYFYVTVTGNLGSLPSAGPVAPQVTFTPSGWLPDPGDGLLFPPAPVTVRIFGGVFSVPLLATDTTSTAWTWQADFGYIPDVGSYVFSFALPSNAAAFTATAAAPCALTAPGTSYSAGQAVTLAGTALPGGFAAGTVYYVTSPSGDVFSLAASPGGPALASSSSGSGHAVPAADISALAQVPSVPPVSQYMLLPAGTPSAGTVPVAIGTGYASRWGVPYGNYDGGSAAAGEYPALVINGGGA